MKYGVNINEIIEYMFCVSRIKMPGLEKCEVEKYSTEHFFKPGHFDFRDTDIFSVALNASATLRSKIGPLSSIQNQITHIRRMYMMKWCHIYKQAFIAQW
jgi:hypothetical protein